MYIAKEERYMDMEYRRCGSSGVKLSALALGLWQNFGAEDAFERCREMIGYAFDCGITYFDLANNYGPPAGAAEETFGRVMELDMRPYRDEMFIATKAGYSMWPGPYGDGGSKKYLVSSLDQSLRRMKLDYTDVFYHHRYDPETPLEETMEALALLVKQGKALYVGISNYGVKEAAEAIKLLRRAGTPCLIHQPRYSMFDRTVEKGLYDLLEQQGVGSAIYSPLAQGLLTNKYFAGIPQDSRAGGKSRFLSSDQITAEKVEKAVKLDEIAQERGQTLAQMAFAWTLRTQTTTSVIMGASRKEQIMDNCRSVGKTAFTCDELEAIEAVLGGDK